MRRLSLNGPARKENVGKQKLSQSTKRWPPGELVHAKHYREPKTERRPCCSALFQDKAWKVIEFGIKERNGGINSFKVQADFSKSNASREGVSDLQCQHSNVLDS